VQTIHEASLTILEEVGLRVYNETAREIFQRHGCWVDAETEIVRFPRTVVEQWRQAFPEKLRFFGRDPKYDITLPDDGPVIATSGAAPDVLDLETGEKRRATLADIARMAHLVNELPGIDIFNIPTLADDAPEGMFNLTRFYAAVKNCLKPVRAGSLNPQETDDISRLGEIVAGGKEAYWERPFLHFAHCSIISPLTMDYNSTTLCLDYARRGITAPATVPPNGGLSAPLTMAGVLAVTNAEFLAINILPQMVRESTPVIYWTLPTIADMRTGAYASGGIECGILHMACAQLARFYGVPSGGYSGLTHAKLSDAQAGFEKGMSPLAGMLAGQDLLVMGGLIDALMTFSFPQVVIDSEIGEMIKRVHHGIPFGGEQLALDLIKEIGPGGMYIDSEHTFKHMRTAAYLPTIADRQSWQEWSDTGRLDSHARAMQRVREILTGDNPAVFSPDVETKIRTEFEGLVAGDSVPPPAWKPPASAIEGISDAPGRMIQKHEETRAKRV
jgi:trimethylamine--corrinoid protein Co-methyltransferase